MPEGPGCPEPSGYFYGRTKAYALTFFAILATVLAKVVI